MNAPDPDLYGPPERGNEEPGDDELWALAAAEQAEWMAQTEEADDADSRTQ